MQPSTAAVAINCILIFLVMSKIFFLHYDSLPVLGTDMPDRIQKLLNSWNF